MQRELVKAPPFWTVGQMIDYMRAAEDLPDPFYDVIIVDPAMKPMGTIPLSRIMGHRRPVALGEIMDEDFRAIPVTQDEEDVAYAFSQYHLVSAPVVDEDGRLVGVITIDDAVEALRASCCLVPFVGLPFRLKGSGEWVIDGGFCAFQPRDGEPGVVTVATAPLATAASRAASATTLSVRLDHTDAADPKVSGSRPATMRSMARLKSSMSTSVASCRVARMAASLTRLARSATVKPGVSSAIGSGLASAARFTLRR